MPGETTRSLATAGGFVPGDRVRVRDGIMDDEITEHATVLECLVGTGGTRRVTVKFDDWVQMTMSEEILESAGATRASLPIAGADSKENP